MKVSATYLAQHWMHKRDHFLQLYDVVEFETQVVFELNVENGDLTEKEKAFVNEYNNN